MNIYTVMALLAINMQHCTKKIQFLNISDDVFADRMNTGLDWIGLGQKA